MKTIAYFPGSSARNSKPILLAFLNGAKKFGLSPVQDSLECDCAVIWSVLWKGRMAPNERIYNHYREQGKPVFVIDVGAIQRNATWKVALDNINALGYYGHTKNLDYSRPQKLGLELKEQNVNNNKIVIAGQNTASEQVENLNSMEEWITDMYNKIRQHTDKEVLIRSHPRSALDISKLPAGIQIPKKIPETYDSFDFAFDWHTIVNYNSGPGIQGAVNGCNVIVDQSSLAYPVSIALDQIENPPVIDKSQWLVELAHTEYFVDEINDGKCIERLLND